MKKFVLLIALFSFGSVYAQTDGNAELTRLNQSTISAYKEAKLDDALKFALQALDQSLKIYGEQNAETATAYTNLGIIQRDKSKVKQGVINLQKAADIYEKLGLWKKLILAYETLGLTQFLGDMKKESEESYMKAIETANSRFGKDSEERFSPTLNLANVYARQKKFKEADKYYLKSYEVAVLTFGATSKEVEQMQDSRACIVGTQIYDPKDQKAFQESVKQISKDAGEYAEMVNGKAVILPKPRYPDEARFKRLGGTVVLRVNIGENGNVVKARAICGDPILAKASEEAVMGAKFRPAVKDGKPMQISGMVTYNFVP